MADIAVTVGGSTLVQYRSLVFTSATVAYLIYSDSASDLKYQKSTNGGQTWGSAVNIKTGTVVARDVWFDKWTPGDSGTIIHIAYVETGVDDVLYVQLDTATDTLGSEIQVFAGASADLSALQVTLAKMRGGNIVCAFNIDNGTEVGSAKSTDGGASFASITSGSESGGGTDRMIMFPGNEADNQDAWLLYFDITASSVTLKTYDDSADSWSESASIATMALATIANGAGYNGAIRHSDGHLIAVIATDRDNAGQDLFAFDINGAGSITALTNVLTNVDDFYNPCVSIDQNNDDLYVGYAGSEAGDEDIGTSVAVYYKKSSDGGTTWGSEITYSDSTYNVAGVQSDLGWGSGRFMPAFNDTNNQDIFVNFDNSVAVGADSGGGASGGSLLLLGVGT